MISEIQSEDQQLLKMLQNIYITTAPGPGKTRRISSSYIRTRLSQNNIPLKKLVINASPELTIKRSCVEVSKSLIEKAVLEYIFKNMPWDKNDTKIKKITVSHRVVLPSGKITFRVEAFRDNKFRSNMTLPVQFYVDRKPLRKIWVTVSLEVMKEVIVATRPLGRYQAITKNDIALKHVDITRLTSGAIFGC